MKIIVCLSLLSLASARPGGIISPWGAPSHGGGVASHAVQPYVHAAPVAVAHPATSYASFQQVVNSVAVQPIAHAAPVLQAPIISQPIVQHVAQPIVQHVAQPVVQQIVPQQVVQQIVPQPVVQAYAQPVVQKVVSVGGYGHGQYGHPW